MGRPARIHYDGALFHVISRGNNRDDLFSDEFDRVSFLNRLRALKKELGFNLYAYCLMTNHIHLLIRVGSVSISEIMHRLLSGYSHEFNRKWNKIGHLFEGRYKALHCANDAYFRELVRYIHMNPVSAGLATRPEFWRWSGYAELIGRADPNLVDRSFVLSMFGGETRAVEEFTLRTNDFELGWLERDADDSAEDSMPMKNSTSIVLPEMARLVAQRHGLTVGSLASPSKVHALGKARKELVLEAVGNGHRVAEIARFLQRSQSIVSRWVYEERRRLCRKVEPGTV